MSNVSNLVSSDFAAPFSWRYPNGRSVLSVQDNTQANVYFADGTLAFAIQTGVPNHVYVNTWNFLPAALNDPNAVTVIDPVLNFIGDGVTYRGNFANVFIAGTKVVGVQQPLIANATGTLADATTKINAILSLLMTHGLMGNA